MSTRYEIKVNIVAVDDQNRSAIAKDTRTVATLYDYDMAEEIVIGIENQLKSPAILPFAVE